jgi:hypothetical protein
MKSAKRLSKILLWVSVLLSIPVVAVALTTQYKPAPAPAYHPPAPAYHPPAPAYHPPAPAYHPPAPAYHPAPAPAYHPGPSQPYSPPSGNGARPSNPSPSAPVRTYTPGVAPSGNTSSPRSSPGGTTYTPHVYTPSSSATSHPSGSTIVSGEPVRNANGVTTYTPHASTGTSYTPAAPATTHGNSYTPAAPPATHGNSYTPAAPGGNSFTPHNNSPAGASGSTHAVYSVPGSAGATAGKPGAGSSTLGPAGSQSVLHQVNTARTGMTGINKQSIPAGQVAVHSDKSLTVTASNGRNYNLRPNGTLASYSAHGQTASFHANGRLASVHTPTMDIAHGPHGQRTVISERPDHSRLVSTGAHRGYLEHSVSYHGHNYNQRTYVHGGHSSTREYAGYHYHGRDFDNYLPRYYYDPLFYGWAYYPWGAPVPYGWDWLGSPWFGFYAGYFSPWDTYPSGAYWLTDFLLGQILADGYQIDAQAGGGGPDSGYAGDDAAPPGDDEAYAPADTPISPEIKQMIAEEVQQQLAYENAAAAKPDEAPALDGLPQVLTPNHLFVVNQGLNVTTADGQQCALSTGDVIKLVATPPDDSITADLIVVSSRKGDCPAGLTVSVPLESLQEMQNNFRAQLDSGLQTLHAQQGKSGLPGAPMSAIAPPPRPADEPPADNENVQALLDAQQQQANQTETSVTQSAFASPQQQ